MQTQKVLSTPDDYAAGVIEGALGLLATAGVEPGEITAIVHATTVASNTVLEGRGARTALITTEGFRDVLEMRRLRIPVMYDLQYDKPPPLVPRRRRYEIAERAGPRGDVWRELDPASVAAVAEAVKRDGVDSAAIALLHSYANPEHEHRAAELVRDVLGDEVYVTCSADILPEIREYERTSTAVVNAYVGPAVTRYIRSLTAKLEAAGITAPLEIMQSGGGTMSPRGRAEAARLPDRVRARGGRDRLRPPGAPDRPAEHDLLRHGRHDREGRDARGRRAGADDGVRDRRRDQPQQPARQGRRLRDQAAVHRRLGDRRRRRLDRRDRRVRRRERRPAERRRRARACLLRARRHRADARGRAGRARLPELERSSPAAPSRSTSRPRARRSRRRSPTASACRCSRPRTAC